MSSETDTYIVFFPEDTQEVLNEIRNLIEVIVPDGTEVIRFGILTVQLNANPVHYVAAAVFRPGK